MIGLREFLETYLNISFVNEMAQINSDDSEMSYFPWNKYKLCIYANDHNPPHFHIISKQYKFDIRIDAISGDLISVKNYGNRKHSDKFLDIVRDAKKWLEEPCASRDFENKDNRDLVRIHWNANNPENKILNN